MSAASNVSGWLRLVDPSGPFFSPPVLRQAFPHGFQKVEKALVQRLRAAYDEWSEKNTPADDGSARFDAAVHHAFVRFVLTEVLGYPADHLLGGATLGAAFDAHAPQRQETLRPTFVLADPSSSPPSARLLVAVYPPDQKLDRPVARLPWSASPATRLTELCRGAAGGVRLGLATNGDEWLLVNAKPGEPAGYATWRAWGFLEERDTLEAFRALLETRRFFGCDPRPEAKLPDATVETLLDRSAENQRDVTERLGLQVRKAVEILVQSFDRIDRDRKGALLRSVPEQEIYEGALAVMMRLVFLFCAEERGLLLFGHDLWDRNYSPSLLGEQLRAERTRAGEEVLEHRVDAWARLLAVFRAVYGGLDYDRLRLPAYGGSLFDPDRFPFLEGRAAGASWRAAPADPPPIDNRTVLHLLDALQLLAEKGRGGAPGETHRLSFRALDIEQIGHVYESLLDFTVVRAPSVVLGLAGKNEPEIPLDLLEAERAKGESALVDFLADRTGKAAKTLQKSLYPSTADNPRCLLACENNLDLFARVRPFASLLRDDPRAYPVVIPAGAAYVTEGSERRSTGTHYTPRSLTEPIVRYGLEPLVYEGPADGLPPEQWRLKSPKELLTLKVCDPAMGSGAFLVEACRYLALRLTEGWAAIEAAHPGRVVISPEGDLSTGALGERPLPREPEERLATARRAVVERCLYGVDKNPTAVEMAKLSLWLATLQKDRAFDFLDHALRAGDSLLGVTTKDQLIHFDLKADRADLQRPFAATIVEDLLSRAAESRRRIRSRNVVDVADAEENAAAFAAVERDAAPLHAIADALVGVTLYGATQSKSDAKALRESIAHEVARRTESAKGADQNAPSLAELRSQAKAWLGNDPSGRRQPRRPFHWLLEFPEVFGGDDPKASGFDAFLGNPPFLGGQRITGANGVDYRDHLVAAVGRGKSGSADLCAYFFLRTAALIRQGGQCALLATNTIAQGDTREVGLDQLCDAPEPERIVITRANPSQPWPGEAALEVAEVWMRRGPWRGPFVLKNQPVSAITSQLTAPGRVTGKPYRLAANAGKSFIGSYVLGMGFVLTPEEAAALIAKDPRNKDVLFPYLNGEDLNSRWDQSPSRWVINFRDWPLDRPSAPATYTGPVAADYPDCLAIVREKVKPERDRNNRKVYRDRWWHYAEKRPDLYESISRFDRVLARSLTAKHNSFALSRADIVIDQTVPVFTFDSYTAFALLQSTIHEVWADLNGGTLETRPRYLISDCFATFPLPAISDTIEKLGERYHAHRSATMREREAARQRALASGSDPKSVGPEEGLTKTYNRFHNERESDPAIQELRRLHVAMDEAVLAAYGWSDLKLNHGFHETRQGLRFTISPESRAELLARLLALNHTRYRAEWKSGLHPKAPNPDAPTQSAPARPMKTSKSAGDDVVQSSLFAEPTSSMQEESES